MYGILKENLYQLSTSFVLGAERSRVYSLQEMRDIVDGLTNTFVEIPKGTKFVLTHRQQSGWVGDTKYSKRATGLISTWESEDGKITNKDSFWAARYLEQYEDRHESTEIINNEFRINIHHSSQNRNINIYRKVSYEIIGHKKYVLCKNTKNLNAWAVIEETYAFKDNEEQLRFNKFLDTVKSLT